jgi:hypothetical protein
MGWIEQQATEAWAPEEHGARAKAAIDFLTVRIEPIPSLPHHTLRSEEWNREFNLPRRTSRRLPLMPVSGQASGYGRGHGRYTGGPSTSSNEKEPRKRQRTERQVEKRREDVVG